MTIPSRDGFEVLVAEDPIDTEGDYAIAGLAGGGFVVGWSGPAAGDPDGGPAPLLRLYDADRNPLGDAFAATDDLDASARLEHLTALPDGGFAILIHRFTIGSQTGPTNSEILRFDAAGAPAGDPIAVADPYLGSDVIGLEALADGRLALVHDNQFATPPRIEVSVYGTDGAAELIRSDVVLFTDGAPVGQPVTTAVGADAVAVVAVTPGALVGLDGSSDATLHIVGADGVVRATTPFVDDRVGFPEFEVTELSDGRLAVFEVTGRLGPLRYETRVHLFEADGASVGTIELPTFEDDFAVMSPTGLTDLVATADGGFLAVLRSNDVFTDDVRYDVMAWKFDAAGQPEGDPFVVNRFRDGLQWKGEATALAGGDLVFLWEDRRDGSNALSDLYAQAYDPSGVTGDVAPTDIVLTGDPVEIGAVGAVIGTLSAVDPDPGDTVTLEIVPGSYSETVFDLEGDVLRYKDGVTAEDLAGVNVALIRATDGFGNIYVEEVAIPLVAPPEPEPEPEPDPDPGIVEKGGGGRDRMIGGAGDDTLKGRGGNDYLKGKGGDDRLDGGGGRDKLIGSGGADLLLGKGGKDRLIGGAGDDTLAGGKGHRDLLKGGGGDDVFLIGRKDGRDKVKDFRDGEDMIGVVSGAERFEDLVIRRKGDDLLIKNGRTKLLLENVDKSDFDDSDVLFL